VRVFLSYSRDSTRLVRELAAQLQELGVDVWLDVEELTPGGRWAAEVQSAVSQSDGVVFLISQEFGHSDHALLEVALAMSAPVAEQKAIIPVRIGRARSTPPLLDQFAYIDGSKLDATSLAQEILKALLARKNVNVSEEANRAAEALDVSTEALRKEVKRQARQLNAFNKTRMKDMLLPLISGLVGVISSVLINVWSAKSLVSVIMVGVVAILAAGILLFSFRRFVHSNEERAATEKGGSRDE
jgi:hypothetical protein